MDAVLGRSHDLFYRYVLFKLFLSQVVPPNMLHKSYCRISRGQSGSGGGRRNSGDQRRVPGQLHPHRRHLSHSQCKVGLNPKCNFKCTTCSKLLRISLQCIKSRTICLRVKRRTGNKLGKCPKEVSMIFTLKFYYSLSFKLVLET